MAELAKTAEDPLDSVLRQIADLARRLASAQYAAVAVPGSGGHVERFVVSGLSPEEISRIDHWPRGVGLLGVLLRERRLLRLNDLTSDPRAAGFPNGHPPMGSFLGVPILWNGKALGNLYITNKLGADEFSDDDERVILALAAHAAVAVENSRLYVEVRDLNHRLLEASLEARAAAEEERRARQASDALLELARETASQVELPRLLDTLVRRAGELMGADEAGVATADLAASQTAWRAISADTARCGEAGAFLIGRSVAQRVIAAGAPLVVRPSEEPDLPVGESSGTEAECARVVLGVPLLNGAESFGALVVGYREGREFEDREVALVTALAGQAAVAIANARLVTSLMELNRTREEEIRLISHDLRAPLTIILGQAQVVSRLVAAGKKANAAAACQAIVAGVYRMNELIQDLVDAARLESGHIDLRRTQVDVATAAADLATRLAAATGAGRVRVETEGKAPPALADPSRLERILTNLLTNALKYSPPDAPVVVRVRAEGEDLLTSVVDRGVGIGAEDLPRLFQRYYRTREAASADGLGLGLYITRKLVEAHGGRVWAESPGPGEGSAFHFTLPKAPDQGAS
jgi:signal transduction histidine kinase